MGWRAVHHGMLAEETGGAIFVDDEFEGLVIPTILAVAVPILVGALFEGDGGGVIETDNEGGGLDCFQGGGVRGVGREEGFTGSVPDVAVLGGEGSDGRCLLGGFVDSGELGFEFGGVELGAVDFVG